RGARPVAPAAWGAGAAGAGGSAGDVYSLCGAGGHLARGSPRRAPGVGDGTGTGRGAVGVAPELASEVARPERAADPPVLFEALLDAVDEAAGDETTLWVLDDIHWADDSTWEFVRYAARRVADLALVLAVTYRDEEIGPAHPWWPGLVRLKREPGA